MTDTQLDRIAGDCPVNLGDNDLRIAKFYSGNTPVYRASTGKCTGKTEIAVAKMLAFHNRGVSDTTWRNNETPVFSEGLVEKRARTIVDAYRREAPDADLETVVLGSAHRLGVYAAAASNSVFLPMQFMAFVKDWEQAREVRTPAVFGYDYDADPLIYMWAKPHTLPAAYQDFLKSTKNIIVVRSTSQCLHKSLGRNSVHFSAFLPKYNFFKAPKINLPDKTQKEYDWEFGLSDAQVTGISDFCRKTGKSMALLEGDTVELYWLAAKIVQSLFNKNKISPERFVFNSYWIAHPYYEFQTKSIPLCAYRLNMDSYCDFIGKLQRETGIKDADAFLNNFGGDDVEAVKKYLHEYFSVKKVCTGADIWENKDSPSRYIAGQLEEINHTQLKNLNSEEIFRIQ